MYVGVMSLKDEMMIKWNSQHEEPASPPLAQHGPSAAHPTQRAPSPATSMPTNTQRNDLLGGATGQ